MPVRSRLLAVRNDLGTGVETDLYQTPAGRTAVVRGLIVVNHTAGPRVVQVRVRSGAAAAIISPQIALAQGEAWDPGDQELVLGPGDRLTVMAGTTGASGSVHGLVSGSLLEGEPQ